MAQTGHKLTHGTIWKQIVLFALPLLAASMIQLLYNFVNQIFAGRFVGTDASAAIAASGLLLACLASFFVGMGVGASVVIARRFVRDDHEGYSKALHTTAALSLIGGVVLTAVGLLCAPIFLSWLQTPAAVFDDAVLYLRIYLVSSLPMVAYNLLAGVIRALGNSRSPMFYQLIGGFVNVVANIVLVAVLKTGVVGPAIATVLAQLISAVLAFRYLLRLDADHRLYLRRIRIDGPSLTRILAIGVPAGVEIMAIALSNLVVISQINQLPVNQIAAFAYYFQLECFIYNPIVALGQAVVVFVSHNVAAGQAARAKKGLRTAILIGLVVSVAIAALMIAIAPSCFGLFTSDVETISYGVVVMTTTFPFYFFYVFIEAFSNAARGSGRSWQPMAIVLGCMCGLRTVLLFGFVNMLGGIQSIALVYPPTWAAAGCLLAAYCLFSRCIDKSALAAAGDGAS